jgi:hypothetical protein
LTIAEQAAKAEKKTKGDNIKDDIWDEEVEHLTMSVKLWSLVRFPLSLFPFPRLRLRATDCLAWGLMVRYLNLKAKVS